MIFRLSKDSRRFLLKTSGATLVEYGVALIVAVVIGGTALSALANSTTAAMGVAQTVVENVSAAADE